MELLKRQDNLSFEAGDVTFIIRGHKTARDKFEFDMLGDYDAGKVTITRTAIFAKVLELFVIDWKGVVEDGKPVPYSYQTLMERWPYDAENDVLFRLAAFIVEKHSLFQLNKADDSKNV